MKQIPDTEMKVKMKDKRNMAIAGFCIFLVFMVVCTLISKAIYTSGLPRVTTSQPQKKNLGHEVSTKGLVVQGQEFGIYAKAGLRVATITVYDGDSFEEGDALFRIDPEDLKSIIEEKELHLNKLKNQQKAGSYESADNKQKQGTDIARAKEDYDQAIRDADLAVNRKRQLLSQAEKELEEYKKSVKNGTVSDGDASAITSLNQAVTEAKQAVEDALLAKEAAQRLAGRNIQDAEQTDSNYSANLEDNRLDAAYLQKEIDSLKELLSADGWVYAGEAGIVTSQKLAVGERTGDHAAILYALDDGQRILEATFTKEQAEYIAAGDKMTLDIRLKSGGSTKEEVVVSYLENLDDGGLKTRISLEGLDVSLGQTASLRMVKQTEAYATCISIGSLLGSQMEGYYVYTVEEYEGILGTEWRVRKIPVILLDKNASYAAIESAGVTENTQIIQSNDKELQEGDVVRVLP